MLLLFGDLNHPAGGFVIQNNGAFLVRTDFLTMSDVRRAADMAKAAAGARTRVSGPVNSDVQWHQVVLAADDPLVRKLAVALDAEPDWVVFYYLDPGAKIHPHRDLTGARLNSRIRFHVPIETNEKVDFRVSGDRIRMSPGDLWCLDTSHVHSVENGGTDTRVHLVCECALSPRMKATMPTGWAPMAHNARYLAALTGSFVKAIGVNAIRDPKYFGAQIRMIGRFIKWRIFKIGPAA